jgi:hypothetical protein
MARRNMTITVDDDVARWARVRAAQDDTSVAQLVGELLRRHMLEDGSYERALRDHLAQKPVAFRKRGSYPSRDRMHDR